MFRFRDKEYASKIISKIKRMNLKIRLMHACGTHQDTLVKFGLDTLLKTCGVEIRQGPGCPVCITTPREIEEAITLAKSGVILATFGDMVRVPGKNESLYSIRASGGDVRIVYSIEDAVEMSRKTKKDVVFMAIGFETTAPATAATLINNPPENFYILNCHRYFPPALIALLEMGEVKLDGLIEPGHVSTIVGVKPYEEISEKFHIPQVISGFEPLDMLVSIYMLARQIKNGEAKVENEYSRAVKYEGNKKALELLKLVFEPCDVAWRGFPIIPNSGMKLKSEFKKYDARIMFNTELKQLKNVSFEEPHGCKCREILRGLIEPEDCPLFGKACTPQHPIGPCMVSVEGACNINFKYGKHYIKNC
ncbi:MAG: hydrogenase formation protein HypD [Candidatus Odinarchaeia archaeon]